MSDIEDRVFDIRVEESGTLPVRHLVDRLLFRSGNSETGISRVERVEVRDFDIVDRVRE